MPDAKRQARHPGERKPPEPAAGFVEVFGGEGGGVGGSGNRRSVPAVWLGGLAGEPGFEVGEMISEVISHPPYRLVRGVDPRLLAFDGYLARAAVPPRPSFCQGAARDPPCRSRRRRGAGCHLRPGICHGDGVLRAARPARVRRGAAVGRAHARPRWLYRPPSACAAICCASRLGTARRGGVPDLLARGVPGRLRT